MENIPHKRTQKDYSLRPLQGLVLNWIHFVSFFYGTSTTPHFSR